MHFLLLTFILTSALSTSFASESQTKTYKEDTTEESSLELNDAVLKELIKLVKDPQRLIDKANTLEVALTKLKRLSDLRNAQMTINTMIESIHPDEGWPKTVTLKHTDFFLELVDKQILELFKVPELLGDTTVIKLSHTIQVDDAHTLINYLCGLHALKDAIYIPNCSVCSESWQENPRIDTDKINPDVRIRFGCGHIYHLGCLVTGVIEGIRTCPDCSSPFSDVQALPIRRNLTKQEIAGLNILTRTIGVMNAANGNTSIQRSGDQRCCTRNCRVPLVPILLGLQVLSNSSVLGFFGLPNSYNFSLEVIVVRGVLMIAIACIGGTLSQGFASLLYLYEINNFWYTSRTVDYAPLPPYGYAQGEPH
jgi:hypothetical protein